MEMRCPSCSFAVLGSTEEEVKKLLMDHSMRVHKMSRRDFETMFSDLQMLATVFRPTRKDER
jgi:predicted small metal-binding protein